MTFNIYDSEGNWLGTVHAVDEASAVIRAQQEGMSTAARAHPRE